MKDKFRWKYFFAMFMLSAVGLIFYHSSQSKIKTVEKKDEQLIIKEFLRHPNMQIQDLYKFIYQASLGSGHAISDSTNARLWLEKEIASMDLSKNDELIEPLSIKNNLARVNLRPYIKSGYSPKLLLDAFIKTANNFKGQYESLKSLWAIAVKLSKNGEIHFNLREMENYFENQARNGFPAVHHSNQYQESYKPAYRVVSTNYIKEIMPQPLK